MHRQAVGLRWEELHAVGAHAAADCWWLQAVCPQIAEVLQRLPTMGPAAVQASAGASDPAHTATWAHHCWFLR